jgi:hypothetical protein
LPPEQPATPLKGLAAVVRLLGRVLQAPPKVQLVLVPVPVPVILALLLVVEVVITVD